MTTKHTGENMRQTNYFQANLKDSDAEEGQKKSYFNTKNRVISFINCLNYFHTLTVKEVFFNYCNVTHVFGYTRFILVFQDISMSAYDRVKHVTEGYDQKLHRDDRLHAKSRGLRLHEEVCVNFVNVNVYLINIRCVWSLEILK